MHFPEELSIKSVGSGYGGNALLGKKCHALRIASWQARDEGWLAEHMLIMGVQNPAGQTHYIAGAFPSACGKTNLAMLVPPASMPGWKIWTVGDDICWLQVGSDGAAARDQSGGGLLRRRARHEPQDQPQRLRHDPARHDLHERRADGRQSAVVGRPGQRRRQRSTGRASPIRPASGPAAHPNSRFTVSAKQNPIYSTLADAPEGVPISAILFGGRRREVAPLVYEARRLGAWRAGRRRHGVRDHGGRGRPDGRRASRSDGDEAVLRLQLRRLLEALARRSSGKAKKLPRIFHVNWFRQDKNGRFMWPGLRREPARAALDRRSLRRQGPGASRRRSAIVPRRTDLDSRASISTAATLETLLSIDPVAWRQEMEAIGKYLDEFGDRVPAGCARNSARSRRGSPEVRGCGWR